MALLSALLAWIGRRLSSVLQAVLGWSVTALFGRLPSSRQTALSVALLVSLLWPLLVVGVAIPAVSAWSLAFVPLDKWIGDAPVRWISVGAAIVLPWGVGALTRWVGRSKSSALKTILAGYPLTLGYAVACVVTAVTVPLVRIASAMRGWHDEHVFVQARPGAYDCVVEQLVQACGVAQVAVTVEPVPRRLLVATRVLEWLARAVVSPIVADEPKRLRGDGLELYLYPADLLLRGRAETVARVRAAMTRGWIERHAFMVSDPGAQRLEEEIQRMWELIARHPDRRRIGSTACTRLEEIAHDLDRTILPFEQWLALDRSLHRVERALSAGEVLHDDRAIEGALELQERRDVTMAEHDVDRGEPTGMLVREALDEIRQLVRLEVALARDEVTSELTRAKAAGVALGAAAALGVSALTLFLVTIAAAFAKLWLASLILGGIVLCLAGAIGFGGWKALPLKPLGQTRERLESDLKQLKERVA